MKKNISSNDDLRKVSHPYRAQINFFFLKRLLLGSNNGSRQLSLTLNGYKLKLFLEDTYINFLGVKFLIINDL